MSHGRACGDIVLEACGCWRETAHGLIELHVAPHVDVRPGGRVYLPDDGHWVVGTYVDVVGSRPTPNGTRVRCRAGAHALEAPIPILGPLVAGRWRWRWWPRDLERPGCRAAVGAFAYDPVAHCDDIRWPGGVPARSAST